MWRVTGVQPDCEYRQGTNGVVNRESDDTRKVSIHEPDLDSARPSPIEWEKYRLESKVKWDALLAENPEEGEVQKFLEENPSFVPGAGGAYNTGHHSPMGGVLFTQPELKGLGRKKVPDFMWISKTSNVITPVLIEIERPDKRWFNSDGVTISQNANQAKGQLHEWRAWFNRDNNRDWFKKTYLDLLFSTDGKPIEPFYILIYSRRSEFHEDRMGEMKGKILAGKKHDEEYMSFDRLAADRDLKDVVTVRQRADGMLVVHAIQPCFTTGPYTGELAAMCGSPEEAINSVPMWTSERREHVQERWNFWKDKHRESLDTVAIRSLLSGE